LAEKPPSPLRAESRSGSNPG